MEADGDEKERLLILFRKKLPHVLHALGVGGGESLNFSKATSWEKSDGYGGGTIFFGDPGGEIQGTGFYDALTVGKRCQNVRNVMRAKERMFKGKNSYGEIYIFAHPCDASSKGCPDLGRNVLNHRYA